MNQDQASALIVEMVQVAAHRGVYSSVEVKAIDEALNFLKKASEDKSKTCSSE